MLSDSLFKSCSRDSENRRGRPTFGWPQCFAPHGVEPKDLGGKAEAKRSWVGPRSSDDP